MSKKTKHKGKDPYLEREIQKYETPIPSREYILAVIQDAKEGGLKRRALLSHFELDDPQLQEAFRRRLKAMVRDGQLVATSKGYFPVTNVETCEGIIVIERDYEGYLHTQSGQKVYLSGASLRGYYDGDRVEAHILSMEKETARGRVVRVLEAVRPLVVGRLVKSGQHFELISFDRKFNFPIGIVDDHRKDAKAGDIVQAEILRDEEHRILREVRAKVIETLGDLSTPGIEVNIALRKFGIPHVFPEAVITESERFGSTVEHSKREERIDLRDANLVTIDGEDAKDFDDAVCAQETASGFRLQVAIADVSHYVKPGSALDKEALNRGNSTYFPGSVVPMLPENLSNGLCSLKPNVERFCVVCDMRISQDGDITRSTFYRAVMQSKARLTYTEVAEIIKGNKALRKQYNALVPSLETLHTLYHLFQRARKKRGAIDFDTVETRILFDHYGKIKTIIPQVRNVAHKMIEESMLAANVCAAKFIHKHKRPSLYRVHDVPPGDKLTALRHFLAELSLDISGGKKPQAKDFAKLVERIVNREDKHMIETVMLRSLSQAQYSPKNSGHFGLAYSIYTHFTSPIRRYPDLLVHRTIIDILSSKPSKLTVQDYERIGLQCSETERRSDDATRDAALALKCHYMEDKVGEHFHGVISGVASFGIFVELKDIYVEGLIHVRSLGNEYFEYDPTHHRMIGEHTRTVYRLGDPLEVTVVKVDAEAKRIDFELLYPPKQTREKRQKKRRKRK